MIDGTLLYNLNSMNIISGIEYFGETYIEKVHGAVKKNEYRCYKICFYRIGMSCANWMRITKI